MPCEIIPDSPPPPPPPETTITVSSANFDNTADWNDQDGNLTTVGTNGPSSFYKTYDQNGNVWEWTDESDVSGYRICRGGGYDSVLSDLNKCSILSLDNTTKNSNTGFRLSRAIQNSEDNDSNIIYGVGMESYTANKSIYNTIISAFQVNLDGSIEEIKRIYYNKIATSSGEIAIPGSGLTRDSRVAQVTTGIEHVNQAIGIVVIGDNIHLLRTRITNQNVFGLHTTINPGPSAWKYFSNSNVGTNIYNNEIFLYVETIQASTGKRIGYFDIETPKVSDFTTAFANLNNIDFLLLEGFDSDGYNLIVNFSARKLDGLNPAVSEVNQISYTIDPAVGSFVSKTYNTITFDNPILPEKSLYIRKNINNNFLVSRLSLANKLPLSFRALWAWDTYIVDKNYNILNNKYIDFYKFFKDSIGWIDEISVGSNNTYTWSISGSPLNTNQSANGAVTSRPSYDGNKLYYPVTLYEANNVLVNPIFNSPTNTFLLGFCTVDYNTLEIESLTIPTFLKDQSNYNTFIPGIFVSEDYARRSDIRSVNFSSWCRVGDSGNMPDVCESSSIGSVDKSYFIQKYPMTNNEYTSFLNVVAKESDPYNLYDNNMNDDPRGGISRSGDAGNYSYTTKPNMAHKPVNFVNWFNAARFANWLHNLNADIYSKETETGAYTLNGAMSGDITVNSDAVFRIPSADEWYKAAFYDHSTTSYHLYATNSSDDPIPVCATITGEGKACL